MIGRHKVQFPLNIAIFYGRTQARKLYCQAGLREFPIAFLRNRRHTETAMTLNFDQTLRREARQCFAYRRLTQRELFLQGRDIKSCARFKATTDQLRAQEDRKSTRLNSSH